MSAQPGLFDHPAPARRIETPAARSTDSEGSHTAAADITGSGVRHTNMLDIIAGVRRYPGRTSAELAVLLNQPHLDRVECARRLPDAKTADKVIKGDSRKCSISNRKVASWWPA